MDGDPKQPQIDGQAQTDPHLACNGQQNRLAGLYPEVCHQRYGDLHAGLDNAKVHLGEEPARHPHSSQKTIVIGRIQAVTVPLWQGSLIGIPLGKDAFQDPGGGEREGGVQDPEAQGFAQAHFKPQA